MLDKEIESSLLSLKKNWHVDPIINNFMLGKISKISDHTTKINNVIFHIPFLDQTGKFILWKCFWPDCNNCCDRQGRLPLTSNDLIRIGKKTNYSKVSNFIHNETNITTWNEVSPQGQNITMTTINLKRKTNETSLEDGTHIRCRFLDQKGYCTLHPYRPGACYLYPFSVWLENTQNSVHVHATFQFTGDCPGFYTSKNLEPIKEILNDYSIIIYKYCMESCNTSRKNFSTITFN